MLNEPQTHLTKRLAVPLSQNQNAASSNTGKKMTAKRTRIARILKDGQAGHNKEVLFEELKEHVKGEIGQWKYPRWIEFVDDLPKNDRGKIDRKALKAREARA